MALEPQNLETEWRRRKTKNVVFIFVILLQISVTLYYVETSFAPWMIDSHPRLYIYSKNKSKSNNTMTLKESPQVLNSTVQDLQNNITDSRKQDVNVSKVKDDWHLQPDKFEKLNDHPVLKRFNIKPTTSVKQNGNFSKSKDDWHLQPDKFEKLNDHPVFKRFNNKPTTSVKQNDNFSKVKDDWHLQPDKFEKLNDHPVFKRFNIKPNPQKHSVDLILIVSSAPNRLDRRTAIRDTWWNLCKSNSRVTVKCVFMTDHVNETTDTGRQLVSEKHSYGDIEFQDLLDGVKFGERFLYHLVWAMQNFNFHYFMRMDDDYFLCVERFLLELPIPTKKLYHWGWVHCVTSIVRAEESIIVLSRDLVELFLGQDPNKLYCHPWADQMIAEWVKRLNLPRIYRHDRRLHHHPPASVIANLKRKRNICRKYIGVHGSYPKEQRLFWKHRGRPFHSSVTLDNFTRFCKKPQVFNWKNFGFTWRYKPKLCIGKPVWDTSKQTREGKHYSGRQGT